MDIYLQGENFDYVTSEPKIFLAKLPENIDFDFGDSLQIDGKYYACSILSKKENFLIVRLLKRYRPEKKETTFEDDSVCPVCGEIHESWELPDETEKNCSCGAVLEITRLITVEYLTVVKEIPKKPIIINTGGEI